MNTLQDVFKETMIRFQQRIKVNGIDSIAFFKEIGDNYSIDKKYMFAPIGTCKQGDLVEFDNCNWLILSQGKAYNEVYEKAVINKCQHTINFIFDGILKSFPALFDTKVMNIDTNQYISVPVNTIKVTMQLNDYTKNIEVNYRFINTGRAWKITGIDKTKDNLITLICDVDAIAQDDDLVNELVNKSAYSINITNANFSLKQGDSIQINALLKKDTTLINGVTFKYSVDNPNIATISDTGLLTGINVGTVNVNVTVKENQYYSAVQVFNIEAVQLVPTYKIEPTSSSISQGSTGNFTCNKYVAGVLTPTTWNIQNLTSTAVPSSGYYTFTVTGGNTFSVKNLKVYSSGKVKIRCTDTQNIDSTSNYVEILITLSGW